MARERARAPVTSSRMEPVEYVTFATRERCDGPSFRVMLRDALRLLESRLDELNALNVFPVPDGDTGTNMVLTLRAAVEAVEAERAASIGAIAAAVARGALLGARGNSGVILSQYLRGMAVALATHDLADGPTLARALISARDGACDAVDEPAEGTILTVADDVARVMAACAERGEVAAVLEAAAAEAMASVERTRELLPVLRRAGVVDAGALGLATILEGWWRSFVGLPMLVAGAVSVHPPASLPCDSAADGFCTEFIIRGRHLDLVAIRQYLRPLGSSVLVVGDETAARVHLHTARPDEAVALGARIGTVERVKIEDMAEQHRRFRGDYDREPSASSCGLVVVASGMGFARLFQSLGATAVVDPEGRVVGSESAMADILASSPMREYVLLADRTPLPPSVGLLLASTISPVETIIVAHPVRALAAAVAFNPARSARENAVAMKQAGSSVATASLIRSRGRWAVRLEDGSIQEGDDPAELLVGVLPRLGADRCEIVTLYRGTGLDAQMAGALADRLQALLPGRTVEVVDGGQDDCAAYLACE
jgi:DAK2 domain fusion protein YloV